MECDICGEKFSEDDGFFLACCEWCGKVVCVDCEVNIHDCHVLEQGEFFGDCPVAGWGEE